ncbi:MAG: NAD(P)-dependent alcohol dehydrogenase [Bacteroidota bacterium]
MKALTLSLVDSKPSINLSEKAKPSPEAGEVLVKIHAAALNRRDYWISVGMYPGLQDGVSLGSDGSGIVEEVGEDVDEAWLNRKVCVNPNIGWGDDPVVQQKTYSILGMPSDGTLAEYLTVPVDRLVEVPSHLTLEEAAAYPLAGLTAYRALFTKAQIKEGDKVLITGIGGGVSQMALQFAVAAGAEVYVTSSSDEKIAKAKELSAVEGFDYKDEAWAKTAGKTSGGFHAVIDSVGGDNIGQCLKTLRPGGKLVIYGATQGPPSKLNVAALFWSQHQIIGSTMGNDQEFAAMMSFVSQRQLKPVIDSIRPFEDVLGAVKEMGKGSQMGKLVLKIP